MGKYTDKYAVAISMKKTDVRNGKIVTSDKLRLYFTEAQNVDEAFGKVVHSEDFKIDNREYTINTWQVGRVD